MSLNPTKGLKAADENDEHIIRQVSKAEMLVGMGKVDDAVAMLRQMLQERPENIQVRTKLKDIYLRSEMMEKAAEECLQLAHIFEARGDSNRATDYLVRAKRLNPATESEADKEAPPATVSDAAKKVAADNLTVKVSPAPTRTEAPPMAIKEPAVKEPPVKAAVLVVEPAPPAPQVGVEQSFVTKDTALAPIADSSIASKEEVSTGVVISTVEQAETALSLRPRSRSQSSHTKGRKSRWLRVSAIAATCMAVLASAAVAGLFAYDRHLDKQYAALVPVELTQAPPSMPESYTEAMTGEQQQATPSEQIEAVTITSPAPDPVERHQQEHEPESIKPEPLPQPTFTTPPPKESKPPSPAPPMIGRVNAGQGGVNNGAGSVAPSGLPLSDSPPPLPPPQAVRKSGGVVRGKVLKRVEPTNPTNALSRLTGTVVVEVLVDERGNVSSARALSGHPVLQGAALSAAKRWKFEPSKLNGTAVQASGQITFNFK